MSWLIASVILPSATWGKFLNSSFLIVIHQKLDRTEEAFLAANCQENCFYLSAGWYETDNFLFKVLDTVSVLFTKNPDQHVFTKFCGHGCGLFVLS